MIRVFALFAWFSVLFAPAALADGPPVLIELFASQNCPSCPQAHRTLKAVAQENDDVLVLTWSVDYWDYLGDADPMAMPEAKLRQAAYADRMSVRAPYTPQSVYDGAKQCPATKRSQVDENIEYRRNAHRDAVPILQQAGETVSVSGPGVRVLDIILVEFLPPEAHATGMVNPIIAMRAIGTWTGQDAVFEASCDQSCAVLLQAPNYGEIYGVLELK